MGEKGSKLTKDATLTAEYLVGHLEPIGNISSKRMFGGHGIFHEDRMFGMVNSKGQSFLKVNDELQSELEALGAQRHAKMPYFTIPPEVLDDTESLIQWARKSIATSKS